MRSRLTFLSCLVGAALALLSVVWPGDTPRQAATSEVLGSPMSLHDVVSGTYGRPEEARRKPKIERAVMKTEKRNRCGKNGAGCASRKPPLRKLNDGYRTLCVRLCDGYYFPVSAAASPGEFVRDEEICRASCSSPAKLFVLKNKGGDGEGMTDLDGKPYDSLITAYQYRVAYDAACTCAASPWTEAAADRHRLYELAEAANGGDAAAEQERARLGAVVAERDRAARARTGADLLALSRVTEQARAKAVSMMASRKVVAQREPIVRPAARHREVQRVRAVRAAPPVRRARVTQRAKPIRLSENRVVYRVPR